MLAAGIHAWELEAGNSNRHTIKGNPSVQHMHIATHALCKDSSVASFGGYGLR
jgi:hypothetical protein